MNYLLRKLMSRVYRDQAGEDGSGNGGGGEGTGEAIGTGNDARVAMLNGIADNADRERADELADINDDDTTTPFVAAPATEEDPEVVAAREAEEAEAARAAAVVAAAKEDAQAAPQQTIIVNGQPVVITPELIARTQKVASADVYLTEAARIKNEAAARANATAQTTEQNQPLDDEIALARAIQMGTEAEAVEAIRKLQKAGPSKDDIARTIDERLTFNEAIVKFRSEYADINGDPVLRKLAFDKDAELLAAGDQRGYYDRYKEIGESLRKWVGSKAPTTAAVENTTAEKLARKAAAPAIPATATGKTSTTVEEEKEESASDVIAGIAKARGGPQWMNGAPR